MAPVDTTSRISQLRDIMKKYAVDVYIVPTEDAHQSEYIAACDARRAYISGFNGSAGVAVVTVDKAALATDGRYFNQAGKQLDSNWELLKQGMTDVPTWQDWTCKAVAGGKVVGVDPTVITADQARKLDEKIKKEGGFGLKPIRDNLVDLVWGSSRPPAPREKVFILPEKYAGKSFMDKITDLRSEIKKKNTMGFVVSMLDEIAWLFNLRGSDIMYNPVFFSYALITQNDVSLYVDDSKITGDVKTYLGDKVQIKPYNAIFDELAVIKTDLQQTASASATKSKTSPKYLLTNRSSWALYEGLGGKKNVEEFRSPISEAKAVKNSTEQQGMRNCHIRDGAALTKYFAWLEDQLLNKNATISEYDAAEKLEQIRSKGDLFVGLSFDTISSTGPNAAVIHYKPEKNDSATIDPKAIYLCDSGAQYWDGTTDTTRTLHFGTPTAKEIAANTLVLKGNIALERSKFPTGTTGHAVDTLARQFLWAQGLDYRHGTGHGVGSFLNVHEGPMGIGTHVGLTEVPLGVGNVLSNEPGYYEDGAFGIRIENMMIVRQAETRWKFGDKPFLGFERLTMTPLCRKLIDLDALTPDEIAFVNDYHKEVLEKTRGLLEGDDLALKWLERETAPF